MIPTGIWESIRASKPATFGLPRKSQHPCAPAVRNVFDCLTRGMTEKEIAEELHRSIHTVHNHVKTIYQEYEVKSKVELLFKVLPSTRSE